MIGGSAHHRWIGALGFAACALAVGLLRAEEPLLLAQFGGQMFQMEEAQLISWAFENVGSVEAAKKRASDHLEGQIEFICVVGTVTPAQRQRLVLAGQGDITRFFFEAEAVIAQQPTGNLDQEKWNKVWQDLQPIRERFNQGLTGEGSLFKKTIRSALDSQQWEAYQELAQQRDGRNYEALVAAAIAELEVKIPLTREQRERLTTAIVAKTKPPKTKLNNYLQYMYVLFRMSQMKDEDLQPIFEESEYRVVKQILQQAAQYAAQFEPQQNQPLRGGGILNWLF